MAIALERSKSLYWSKLSYLYNLRKDYMSRNSSVKQADTPYPVDLVALDSASANVPNPIDQFRVD